MVFCGFVIAWRLATWPTSRSPLFVNATTEGVVRPPSALGITCGSPASITATHEFVVRRSMPMIFPMLPSVMTRCGGTPRGPPALGFDGALGRALLRGLDRDLASLGFLGLRHRDFQNPVAIRRLDLVRLDRVGQAERTLERAVHPLEPVVSRVLLLLRPGLLAADRKGVVFERDLDVLELQTRQLEMQRVAIGLLLDVHRRLPQPRAVVVGPPRAGEDALQLILHRNEVSDRIPAND